MNNFFYGILLFAAGGILSLFIKNRYKSGVYTLISIPATLLLIFAAAVPVFKGETITHSFFMNFPFNEVKIVMDPLAGFFIMIISVMSLAGVIYSGGYLQNYRSNRMFQSHYFFISLLTISQLLVVTVHNWLAFLFVWEIMSLSSFFLVVFEYEKKEVLDTGLNYLVMMHIGFVFLVLGFMISAVNGSGMDFDSVKEAFSRINPVAKELLFIIFFIGFGMKAGFVPLYTWLPRAHPAAPSHVSGIMSGIMIKTGLYGILRICLLMGTPSIRTAGFVLLISVITAVLGILYSISQRDIKKALAYSSIENIGIAGMGIGLGMLGMAYSNQTVIILGFGGALIHIMNHSIFKQALFQGAGSVYLQVHTRDMEQLGGLDKKMPETALCFLLSCLAICGLPPFNGFIGKFILYYAMFCGLKSQSAIFFFSSTVLISCLSLIGILSLLGFTKLYSITFAGFSRSSKTDKAKENSVLILFPMAILACLALLLGIFPQFLLYIVKTPAELFAGSGEGNMIFADLANITDKLAITSASFAVAIIVLIVIRKKLLAGRNVRPFKTWDCGYQRATSRMQYTGSSFSDLLLSFFSGVTGNRHGVVKPEGAFPEKASYNDVEKDFVEKYFITGISKGVTGFLDLFKNLQSGKMQMYILYGLIFLVIVIAVIFSGIKVF